MAAEVGALRRELHGATAMHAHMLEEKQQSALLLRESAALGEELRHASSSCLFSSISYILTKPLSELHLRSSGTPSPHFTARFTAHFTAHFTQGRSLCCAASCVACEF